MAESGINATALWELCLALALECDRQFRNVSDFEMEHCFLRQCFPPQALQGSEAYPQMVIYCLILITGIIGNFAVCAVSKACHWLHHVTGDYLLNLAVADLVSLTAGLPFEIYSIFHQYCINSKISNFMI